MAQRITLTTQELGDLILVHVRQALRATGASNHMIRGYLEDVQEACPMINKPLEELLLRVQGGLPAATAQPPWKTASEKEPPGATEKVKIRLREGCQGQEEEGERESWRVGEFA